MKTIKIIIALLAVSASIAKAQFIKAELQVSGLTCSMCSKATEKSLRTLPFVADVKPDLNRNLFTIIFKPAAPVNLGQMNKKVQGAGFSISNLKAIIDFDKLKVTNNSFTYAGDTFQLINAGNKDLNGHLSVTVANKGFAPAPVVKKYSTADGSKAYRLVI